MLATESKLQKLKYIVPDASLPDISEFEYLDGCDVIWKKQLSSYQGLLVNGECKLCSLTNPNLQLVIKDELKLRKNELWINDRVYTSEGKQIIGNKDGIPYKMEKRRRQRDAFGAKSIYDRW